MILVVLLIVVLIALGIYVFAMKGVSDGLSARQERIEGEMREVLSKDHDFLASKMAVSHYAPHAIALDEDSCRIAVAKLLDDDRLKIEVFEPHQIYGSEIDVDGRIVARHSNGSVAGRALLGGAIAGSAGAIVGGLSGDQTQIQKVRSIHLKVLVDDVGEPERCVTFFQTLNGGFADAETAEVVMEGTAGSTPADWHNRLVVMMEREK